jgi:hypothetical protein
VSISSKLGKVTGKIVHGAASAPKATGRKIKAIGHDLGSGYREVVPAKPKKVKEESETPEVIATDLPSQEELVTALEALRPPAPVSVTTD